MPNLTRLAAAWDDLLDDAVSAYTDRLQEISSNDELWKCIRAWDKYNKERRRRKVGRRLNLKHKPIIA